MPVATKFQGRLGNQLFQFAFIYAVARKLGTSYFIEGLENLSGFRLSGFSSSKNQRTRWAILLRYVLTRIFTPNEGYLGLTLIRQKGIHSPTDILKQVDDYAFFEGFFQSEAYWREYASEIKEVFRLEEKWTSAFKEQKSYLLEEPYLAIHIRRGDYADWEIEPLNDKDFRLPVSYYYEALERLNREKDLPIVIISDDAAFVEKHFNHLEYRLEYNSVLIDFQILTHARALIISNSSFAWWGAYLNPQDGAKVLAPKYWLGFKQKKEYPTGIMEGPFEWIEID